MAKFFVVQDNCIVNAIVADTKEIAEQVTGMTAISSEDESVSTADIGAVWNEATQTYVNPVPEPTE